MCSRAVGFEAAIPVFRRKNQAEAGPIIPAKIDEPIWNLVHARMARFLAGEHGQEKGGDLSPSPDSDLRSLSPSGERESASAEMFS